jgi:uncharacterized protein (TIGR02646 family)
MIQVSRAAPPAVLLKNAAKWLSELRRAKTRKEQERWRNKYRHKDVKDGLVNLFHGKCAYCESKITHVDYGDIEHYRPKSGPSGRPDLTFEWTNLLLGCGICNGSAHKGARFPEADEGGPIINPCEDDPGDHFDFNYDPVLNLASVYGKTGRGRVTEVLLGLNRKDLRVHRSNSVKKFEALLRLAPSHPEIRELIEEGMCDNAEYAAFARSLSNSSSSTE